MQCWCSTAYYSFGWLLRPAIYNVIIALKMHHPAARKRRSAKGERKVKPLGVSMGARKASNQPAATATPRGAGAGPKRREGSGPRRRQGEAPVLPAPRHRLHTAERMHAAIRQIAAGPFPFLLFTSPLSFLIAPPFIYFFLSLLSPFFSWWLLKPCRDHRALDLHQLSRAGPERLH